MVTLNNDFDLGAKVHLYKSDSIAHLKVDKAFIEIPNKYTDFADISFQKFATKLSKYISINNFIIKLVNN